MSHSLQGDAVTGAPAGRGTRRRYRADIDGLRAVAVILVILYHLTPSLVPGGFVGVDVFFVVSGFVVTGSILDAPASGGWQAVSRFWRRRILRLLPALISVVLAGSVLLAMLRVPFPILDYRADFRSGIAALIGVGNLYLYRADTDYFTGGDTVNPFVHLWSLGVEEQFYLIFAVLFIAVAGLIQRRTDRIRASMVFMALLGIISYVAFVVQGSKNATPVYYLLPFRFWEIAAGSFLAYLLELFPDAVHKVAGARTGLIQFLGAGLLARAVSMAGAGRFPWWQINLSVAAAVFMLAAGAPGNFVSRILSARIMVLTGLASYSLYLWHYPILRVWQTELPLDHPPEHLAALSIIAGVSVLSYNLIERTFRYSRLSFSRVLLPALVTCLAGTIALAAVLQAHPGAIYAGSRQRWDKEWTEPEDYPFLSSTIGKVDEVCTVRYGDADRFSLPAQCIGSVGSGKGPMATLLAIGDSHARADRVMTAFGFREGAYRLATLTDVGCVPDGPEPDRPYCDPYWRAVPIVMNQVLRDGDSVLISFLWPMGPQWRIIETIRSMGTIAQAAGRLGVEVLIEAPLPTFERPAYLCTPEWYRWDYDGCAVSRSEFENRRAFTMVRLRDLARHAANVRIWDPLPWLCPGQVCSQFREGKPVFRDRDHISLLESESLGPVFLAFWRQSPLKPGGL